MTELTPEQLAEIRRQQSAWNAEFRVRPSKPNIGIEDFCAMHASVTRMLHHIDAQAAQIAELEGKVREVRGRLAALNPAAIDALRADNQQQLDYDGVMVGVSRQAADETVATLDNLHGDCDALMSDDPTACPCRCHEPQVQDEGPTPYEAEHPSEGNVGRYYGEAVGANTWDIYRPDGSFLAHIDRPGVFYAIFEELNKLHALRASIAALADEWDAIAKRQRYQAEWDARRDYADSAAVKDGKAIGYEACARELRQLGEGNGRD